MTAAHEHTAATLTRDLGALGIGPADTLLVHSSLKSVGAVAGGADTVLDVLMAEVGTRGLLLFPTLTWRLNAANPEFSVDGTASIVGILPELFRRRPGVVRSWHPTHSMAGFGADAAAFLAGHERFDTPCAPGSPWGRLAERGAKIAFIGTGLCCNTFLHGIEERAGVPGALTAEAELLFVTTPGGQRFAVPSRRHREDPEHSQFYGKIRAALTAAGALRAGPFGDAECLILDARRTAAVALALLRTDLGYFTHA